MARSAFAVVLAVWLAACFWGGGDLEPGQCRNALNCDVGEACQRSEGQCQALGTCVRRPEVCIQVYEPVCGCDGLTYPNACAALAAGFSVAAKGPCP